MREAERQYGGGRGRRWISKGRGEESMREAEGRYGGGRGRRRICERRSGVDEGGGGAREAVEWRVGFGGEGVPRQSGGRRVYAQRAGP